MLCGVTQEDHVRNEYIRGAVKVVDLSQNVQGSRSRWYGHVMRRDEEYMGTRMIHLKRDGMANLRGEEVIVCKRT